MVKVGVQDFPFNIPDMTGSLDLKDIWDSCPEKHRRTVDDTDLDDSEFVRGALISVLAGFLCKAAGVEPEPKQVERVTKDGKYRGRLLDRASSSALNVGNQLKGRRWMNEIATAFWG
ncbi:hypothetical protein AKJ40_03875 [candidate division MSBL1 archaeon SCGC-AAA259M10]|uniref:Uncharacterized protein n=1 Tax=candidate division MSBL1 archaeon SCGC-AAA259M10 TaxID=1698270 RepID=A0A133UY97_9EURY|nr:hypothetical protein AKJ40_03875 [candidate division MSBL1 archaeon SCGC-AAA259M10]